MEGIRVFDRVRRVASFVDGVLGGNPAGVWVAEEGEGFPPEAAMQATAAEVGYSETVYAVAEGEGGFRLRYFTPEVELPLAGHPTLAAAHVLWEEGLAEGEIGFTAEGGALTAAREADGSIWMDFPADVDRPEVEAGERDDILGLLELKSCETMFRARGNVVVVFGEERQVLAYREDFAWVAEVEAPLVVVTAPAPAGRDYAFVSRVFGPRVGVGEDPVTGSAHCFLGPHWSGVLGLSELAGYQASERGGLVRVRYSGGERVGLGGLARGL